jgi:DNA (cytosine-5)-methyltransferase 1
MSSSSHQSIRSDSDVSRIMSRIGSKHTEPEKVFRRALRKVGLRSFTLCDSSLPGKPDIVLPSKKLAVFIDGDFWHGNQYRLRGFDSLEAQLTGVRHSEYWSEKITRNVCRDFRNTAQLIDSGWRVLRFWESEIRQDIARCVALTLGATRSLERTAFSSLPRRTVVELFAGIGLVRLALAKAGWTTVFANDNDPQKFEMYRANFDEHGFDTRDIHELAATDIPSCGLLTASFPCNDLSLAGGRAGLNGGQSGAFWGVIRLLKEMGNRRPPIVLLENVPGFLTSHAGRDFESALLALNELRYSCDAMIMDASWFVPQSRVRLFVIAKQGAGTPVMPQALSSALRPKLLADFIRSHPTLAWDIRSVPEVVSSRVPLNCILEDVPDGDPRWWSEERTQYFMNQLSLRHRKLADFMISGKTISYGTAFRRVRNGKSMAELRADGTAGCLRTPRGGSGRQILFEAGCGQRRVRLLTPRECARLQGVADNEFSITGPDNRALFGFGDAVCVPVVQWIAENYLNPLASEMLRGRVLRPPKNLRLGKRPETSC